MGITQSLEGYISVSRSRRGFNPSSFSFLSGQQFVDFKLQFFHIPVSRFIFF